jgi:dUTP pyrophosphatase
MSRVVFVRIKRMGAHALPIPSYANPGDAGLDLATPVSRSLWAGHRVLIGCGFAFEIPAGFEGQVRPRSGLASKGIIATLGTIDAGYRGEVLVQIENRSNEMYVFDAGDRIAQLVIAPIAEAMLEEVEELNASTRGTGALGSSGR